MKPVTIDSLDLKDHVRWAQDQQEYDITLVTEAQLVALHPEILGTSIIYPSRCDELFELQKRNLPWACFVQPKFFQTFSKRFYSYQLFPSMYLEESGEGSDKEDESNSDQEKEEESESNRLIKHVLNLKTTNKQTQSLFEKDKTVILSLLETIKDIDSMLKQINSRKLQYQKG